MGRVVNRLAFALAFCVAPVFAAAPGTITAQDVLQHLNQTIAWYQRLNALDQTAPENVLLQDTVRDSSRRSVQLAFAFAHAEAAMIGNSANTGTGGKPAPNTTASLQQAAERADQRVDTLQARIDGLNQQIEKQSGRKRATLTSQRDALLAFLNLAKESQAAVKNMMAFANAPGAGSGEPGLLNEINELENSNSIAAALNTNEKASTPRQTIAGDAVHPEFAGLLTLITNAVRLARSRMQVDSLVAQTNALAAEINRLKIPIRTALRSAIDQGDTIASESDAQNNPAQLNAAREQLDRLASQFKSLVGVMTPLGEQSIVLESVVSGLGELRNAIDQQYDSALRYLAIRSGVLGLGIVLLLAVARLWHKAIFRYVQEPRRRRQFMLLRRLVIAFAIVVAVALGFFTSFSSVATFVGFLTAGLALALQNVILSVVAYFFLIGRYGLRVGDRVTVSGVTGQVIEIGLVRFFLMELAGTGADLRPTGRVAVWANSMIFQPYSWLKQTPGTEYVWHAVSVTLVPEMDLRAACDRLTAAVTSVFDSYRNTIEQKHAVFERSLSVQMSAPQPVGAMHFTDAGCEILIRYPVEAQHTSDIDSQVMHRVLEEMEKEPKLTRIESGTPKIQTLP